MNKYEIDGVEVTAENLENFTEHEAKNYVDYVRKHTETSITEIKVTACNDGKVDVSYRSVGEKFERIRRITGYLTGDVTSWNDAKRAEERERVKHTGERFVFS